MDEIEKNAQILENIDYAFMVTGGVILLIMATHWWLKAKHDPLRGAPIRACKLSPALMWLCILIYPLGWMVGIKLATLLTPDSLKQNIRTDWQGMVSAAVIQILMSAFCLIIAGYTFRAGLRGLGIFRRPFTKDLITALVGWLSALCICGIILMPTQKFIEWIDYQPPLHSAFEILHAEGTKPWMDAIIIIGAFILAPIGEELFFRGILQTGIKKLIPPRWGSMRHRWAAITLVAVLFGAMHMNTPHYIPTLIVLGFIFGYLYERTGSLLAPILAHMLFNGKSLLWFLIR